MTALEPRSLPAGRVPAAPRILSWIVFAVTGPPALAAVVLAAVRPEDASWWLAVALCGVCIALGWAARRPVGWRVPLVLVALPLALLTWPEMGLRVAGFRRDHALMVFGFPAPDLLVKMPHDPELFWRLPADYPGANSLGFTGPEFRIPKPEGTFRLMFLGDSCAMQGYPKFVPPAMQARDGVDFDSVNLGIAGYTSHQGVVLARRWTGVLEPDVVVVCFGWNDHWRAFGAPDSAKHQTAMQSALRATLLSTRTTQWLASKLPPDPPLDVTRVSEAEYASNLTAIGDIATRAGAKVLLMTAPTSAGVMPVPEILLPDFAENEQVLIERHRAYNDVVRRVAQEHGWRLLDLAAEIPQGRLTELFTSDTVHFSGDGLVWMAERIAREVDRMIE
jgi:lysophospholipase L1-like esterase